MSRHAVPAELEEYIKEEVRRRDWTLLDVVVRGEGVPLFEIIVDKGGGITLEECGSFNRNMGRWMDERGLFVGGYVLDVCSPGLDRELRTPADFLWAVGKQVKVITAEAVDEKREFTGRLAASSEGGEVVLETASGGAVKIPRSKIARIRLIPEVK